MVDLSPKTKKIIAKLGKALSLLAVIALLAWIAVVNPYLTRKEKQRFEAAAASLQTLADEIQTKVGKADDVNVEKSCGRAHMKSEDGPVSCNVMVALSYNPPEYSDANTTLNDVALFIGAPLRRGPLTKEVYFSPNPSDKKPEIIYQNNPKIEPLSCVNTYELYSLDTRPKALVVQLSCGGPARAEHYPLKD